MPLKLAPSFSFFGSRDSALYGGKKADGPGKRERLPAVSLQTDKEVYRPGDSITATIEICCPEISNGARPEEAPRGSTFMLDSLSFEFKGIEKLDTQWFATLKPLPGSKEKRGEYTFLESTASSIVSKVIISSGSSKSYLVRTQLPKILPPSYRGTTVRYMYCIRSTVCGRWLLLENGHHDREPINDLIQLEVREPLQIWGTQKSSSVLTEENQIDGIAPVTPSQMDIYWKEKNSESEWVRAIEPDELEEDYDSSRDEISSVSSYNPIKGNNDFTLRSSLSMQSIASRLSTQEARHSHGESSNLQYLPLSQLSVLEVGHDANIAAPSLSQRRRFSDSPFSKDELKANQGPVEPGASESFARGKSYNIRIDDEVLLKFSPKNSDSTYYFGDMIGGTLHFFHGARRCLEVSVTLETSETISQHFVHHSRRSSPTVTKVQSDHHMVVADLVETNFLFSIPMDGPTSFSTPHVSVHWALRFEFFTNPMNVDLSSYEHPLLVEDRERGEWVLPITVHALPPHGQALHRKNQKPFSLGNLCVRT